MSLRLEKLAKSFNGQVVLRNLSLDFSDGEIVLLLGANGAGKSTLLRCISGLCRPDKGKIDFEAALGDRDLGYVSHNCMAYGQLTVRENLDLYRALRNVDEEVPSIAKRWSLDEHLDKRLNQLSKGLQLRLALSVALMHSPRYLIFDEPSSALDDKGVEILIQQIQDSRQKRAEKCLVIIATHDLERLKNLSNRVLVLSSGVVQSDSKSIGIEETLQNYRSLNR